jgi:Sap, sulfolipid-1-addressing protein
MWGSVLVVALLAAFNPMRLGIAVLVMSRPRPAQNLLAFWFGCLITSVSVLLVPLTLLHFTPMFRSFAHDLASPATVAGSTVRHIQIGVGVLALSAAALMTVLFSVRRRARLPTPADNTTSPVQDSNTPIAISRLLGRSQDAGTKGGSAIRRLLGRARNVWENGSLWVAFVIGLGSGPSPDGVLYVLAIIVPSGAAFGAQVSAAIAFVAGMLAVVEIILASFVATPAKSQAVARQLHDWALAHRQQVMIAIFAVAGVSLVALGMGWV